MDPRAVCPPAHGEGGSDRGSQRESDQPLAGQQAVGDVDGVLAVRQEHPFFHDDALDLEAPDGQLGLQPELLEVLNVLLIETPGCSSTAMLRLGKRTRSQRWLSMTTRPWGAGSAATSSPWYRRVMTPATVPDA